MTVCLETRTSGSKQVWQLLKNACEADNEDAFALIQAAQLQLPQDSLTTAIDQAGVYYRVPICCIQLPDNYNVDNALAAMKAKKAPKEKQIAVSSNQRSWKETIDLKSQNKYFVPFSETEII